MGSVAPIEIVGVHGGTWYGRAAGAAVSSATVLAGSARHLDAVATEGRRLPLVGDLGSFLDRVAEARDRGERVCVLASGDPGFFGLVRLARGRFGADGLRVHPAPSAVALAFAAAGLAWDDSVVVSAHGRDPRLATDAVSRHAKVAVLCSPDAPPEEVGRRVVAAGCGARSVTVGSHLGDAGESVWAGSLTELAAGAFDPMSVVVFFAGDPAPAPGWRWGRPEAEFAHRGGMITKAEVRAVALGKLGIPASGVMWDVGAGSGSVAAECAALAPGLRIYAVEKRSADIPLLRQNLQATAVSVVEGEAPAALAGLPDPDRAFVGGGGVAVLDAVRARLRTGGVIVATYAAMDRATAAASRLGNLVQVSVNRAVPVGDGALRLAAENPVFVCWGPG